MWERPDVTGEHAGPVLVTPAPATTAKLVLAPSGIEGAVTGGVTGVVGTVGADMGGTATAGVVTAGLTAGVLTGTVRTAS